MTQSHNIVALKVYNKRFVECGYGEKAKINSYIQHRGNYAIQRHPDLIKDSFDVVVKSASESNKMFDNCLCGIIND